MCASCRRLSRSILPQIRTIFTQNLTQIHPNLVENRSHYLGLFGTTTLLPPPPEFVVAADGCGRDREAELRLGDVGQAPAIIILIQPLGPDPLAAPRRVF